MIGKLIKGKGARGLIDYLLDERDQKGDLRPNVQIVGGTLAGRNAREIAAEFGALHRLRPKLGVHVIHESLRIPEGDADPDPVTWAAIAQSWADDMGIENYVAVSHGDGHIHIAGSRINADGSVVSDQHDYKRSEAAIRKIEIDFELTVVESSHLLNKDAAVDHHKAPTREQMIYNELTGEVPPAMAVAAMVDQIITDGATVTEMVSALEEAGISVHPNIASTGRMNGLAYEVDGFRVTSKAMGRGFTWKNLQERGLSYEPDRDDEALRAAKSRRQFEAAEQLGADGGDRIAIGRDQDVPSIRERHGEGEPDRSGTSVRDGRDERAGARRIAENGDVGVFDHSISDGSSDDLDHLVHLAADELDQNRGNGAATGNRSEHSGRDAELAKLADHLASDLTRCGQQVGRFIQAAGAAKYQIMTRIPDVEGGKVRNHTWLAAEVLDPKNVRWMRSQNAAGAGVFIRPLDRRLIVIDDLTTASIDKMNAQGYQPSIVLETSPANLQAWVRLVADDMPEPSPDVATGASRALTKAFDGDRAAVGSSRFGRMPGFTNRKPKHEVAGRSPWVTIKVAAYRVASAGYALIEKIEGVLVARATKEAAQRLKEEAALPQGSKCPTVGSHDAERLFLQGVAWSSMQPDLTQSEIDFRACGYALKHGSTETQVEELLLKHSPDIETRHHNVTDYVARTVRKAAETDFVRNRDTDSDKGFEI